MDLHVELEKAEARRSWGKAFSEPKIRSQGRDTPWLYLFRESRGLACITPESNSASILALLRWPSEGWSAPESVEGPLGHLKSLTGGAPPPWAVQSSDDICDSFIIL